MTSMLRSRVVNSAVAFALAVLVSITLHELSHAVTGLLQGGSPELFPFSVEQGGGRTEGEQIATALTGPVFSLLSGLLILAAPLSGAAPFWRLAWLWLGVTSVQSTFGYLITGPFAADGDVGRVWDLTGTPALVAWLGFAAGWAGTAALGWYVARHFGALISDRDAMRSELPQLGVYGWLVGTVLALVVSLPVLGAGDVGFDIAFFSALGLMACGVCVAFLGLFQPRVLGAVAAGVRFGVPTVGLVALVVVALFRLLVLGPGLAL